MPISLKDIDDELARRQAASSPSLADIDAELARRGAGVGVSDILPDMAKEAIGGVKELGTQISGLPRDAMRTFGTAAGNMMSGVRPDVALAEAAMTQMRPDAAQVNPVEKTASLGADIMDPRMEIASPAVGEAYTGIVKPATEAIGRTAARAVQIPTGLPAADTAMVAEQPLKALWSKTRGTAGKIFGNAKTNAGVTRTEEKLIAGSGDPSGYKRVADAMEKRVNKLGEDSLSTGQLLAWKNAANQMSMKAKGSAEALYAQDASRAESILKKRALIDPKVAEVLRTQKETSFAIARSKFGNVIPQNKTKGDAVVRGLLQGAVSTLGGRIAGIPGAVAGAAPFAPAAYFVPTVAAGLLGKGLNVIGENPAIRQTLLGILQNIQSRQNGK